MLSLAKLPSGKRTIRSGKKIQLLLKVPYAQKDTAKALGAKWSAAQKSWYVPHGIDVNPFQKWWAEELKTEMERVSSAGSPKSGKAADKAPANKAAPRTQAPSRARGAPVITGPAEIAVDTSDKLPWQE